jgi:putative transposase
MEKKLRKAFLYRLNPTDDQVEGFLKYSQATRFIFNWGLAQIKEQFDKPKVEGEPKQKLVNYYDFCRDMTQLKKTEQYAWLAQTPCHTLQSALRNLDEAMKHFFRRVKLKEKPGFPKFKSRYRDNSFRFPDELKPHLITRTHIYMPKIGWVPYVNSRPFEGIIKTVTVKQEGKYWYVMLSCLISKTVIPATGSNSVTLDLGITKSDYSIFLRSSDGFDIKSPNFYQCQMERLGNLQKAIASKDKESGQRESARAKLASIHLHIKRQRNVFLHRLSTDIIHSYDIINVKSIAIKELMKDEQFALALSDAGWHTFVLMLKNKAEWFGKQFIELKDKP